MQSDAGDGRSTYSARSLFSADSRVANWVGKSMSLRVSRSKVERKSMQLYSKVMTHLSDGWRITYRWCDGTEIERRGAMDEGAWCAKFNKTHPDILKSVHRDYIRAGARVITTNTFSTNRNMLEPQATRVFELLNDQACALALATHEKGPRIRCSSLAPCRIRYRLLTTVKAGLPAERYHRLK